MTRATIDTPAAFLADVARGDPELTAFALHESAHQIAATALGIRSASILIRADIAQPTGGWAGGRVNLHTADFAPGPEGTRQAMTIAAAAIAAETKHYGAADPVRTYGDATDLEEAATRLYGTLAARDVRDAEIDAAKARAAAIVDEHWEHILALAARHVQHTLWLHDLDAAIMPQRADQ